VDDGDGLMLVTNGGQLIRVPVDGIRVAGRGTQGVTVFKLGGKEEVVSVERIPAEENDNEAEGAEGEDGAPDLEGGQE
jgi:DNA gyrase subunit A